MRFASLVLIAASLSMGAFTASAAEPAKTPT